MDRAGGHQKQSRAVDSWDAVLSDLSRSSIPLARTLGVVGLSWPSLIVFFIVGAGGVVSLLAGPGEKGRAGWG